MSNEQRNYTPRFRMRCYAFPYIYRDIRLKSVVFNPCILRPRVSPAHDPTAWRDLTWPGGRTLRSVYWYEYYTVLYCKG